MISASRRRRDIAARDCPGPCYHGPMARVVVIAALLVCMSATARGEDRAAISSDGLARAIFCSSPRDHSDCIEGCALRLKELPRYRACVAACTNLYCPRK